MNSRIKVAIGLAVVAVSATVFVESASAQMRRSSFARAARPRISARLVGPRFGFNRTPFGGFFPGYPYLPSYYYPGYDYEEYEPSAAPAPGAPVVVVQSAAPAPAPVQNPVESVVLENRGGQWVRISSNGQIPAVAEPAPGGAKDAATQAPRPKPTVLVFRDRHNEEVERYMVKGDFIYAGTNYWSTGAWTRKIPIAELDVPATQKLNEERGLKFSLPSGPNEVILRP
jgi:hypothetical protein